MYSIVNKNAEKSGLSMIAWDVFAAASQIKGNFNEDDLRDLLNDPCWYIRSMGTTSLSCHTTIKYLDYGINELLNDGIIAKKEGK